MTGFCSVLAYGIFMFLMGLLFGYYGVFSELKENKGTHKRKRR